MKFKSKPGSKIPTTQMNTNKKKEDIITETPKRSYDTSVIKKNEFALILFGALLLTIIVFFLFFKSSDSKTAQVIKSIESPSYAELEERIQSLEQQLKDQKQMLGDTPGLTGKQKADMNLLSQRVTRLENAFSIKFDSVIERLAGIEKNISVLKTNAAKAAAKPAVKKPVAKPVAKKTTAKAPVKKTSSVKAKNTSVFHTVAKGETLYSISKKYGTTVNALRKLNNLSSTAKIYPGDNILVK